MNAIWQEQSQSELITNIASLKASDATLLTAKRTHLASRKFFTLGLDIALHEDDSRLYKESGAHNFTILRHIALNALKQ